MTEIQEINIADKILVRIEKENITIYRKNHLRCSGVKESIDYLLYHSFYFNTLSNKDALIILEAYQEYYRLQVLQEDVQGQKELTEFLFELQDMFTTSRHRIKFFRTLYRHPQFRHNYEFWQIIFDTYFDSGDGKVGKLASRILLHHNPNNPELWSILTEFYNNINYRKAMVKRILIDIQENNGQIY